MSYKTLFCVSCLVTREATLYRWQTTHEVYSARCRCGQSDTNQQQREDSEDCEGLHSPPGSGLHTALSVIYKDSELKQVHVSLLHIAQWVNTGGQEVTTEGYLYTFNKKGSLFNLSLLHTDNNLSNVSLFKLLDMFPHIAALCHVQNSQSPTISPLFRSNLFFNILIYFLLVLR